MAAALLEGLRTPKVLVTLGREGRTQMRGDQTCELPHFWKQTWRSQPTLWYIWALRHSLAHLRENRLGIPRDRLLES